MIASPKSPMPWASSPNSATTRSANLLKLTDANGGATQHSYDTKNRLLTRTDPLLKNETYQYDGNDNTIKVTDRKAQITTQTYDALDRPSPPPSPMAAAW